MTAGTGKRQRRREELRSVRAELLPLIGEGSSLPAAIKTLPPPRPTVWALRRLLQNDHELDAAYREACELRADALADELVAVASEEISPELRGPDASAWVQRQRLRLDALKWTPSKLRPRAWVDRLEIGVEVTQQISMSTALAAAERRLEALHVPEGEMLLLANGGPRARIGAQSGASPEKAAEP